MQLAETRAVRVTLVLGVSCLAFEIMLSLLVEFFFACSGCSGRRRDAQPF